MRPKIAFVLLSLSRCLALDYYRELGVTRRASHSDIKAAYRELAKKFHPDKNKEASAQSKFQRIALAYETLSDPEKRRQYDMHGDDYANVDRQQRQRGNDFFDPFNQYRRRPQVTPLFSSTIWLSAESYRDLVEDASDTWLLLFYHDWNDQCKDFLPRWEALAGKLSPMVQLGRVSIDHNFGLIQRYRSFVRCRQTAFFMECNVPTIVLVTPDEDGAMSVQGYRGHLAAEHIYDWVKRSLPDSRHLIKQLGASDQTIRSFLLPPWAGTSARRAARLEDQGRGRQKSKAIVFSARAISDSLLARHIAQSFKDSLVLASVRVDGGLNTNSAAAQLARSVGVTELPTIAVWPDGLEESQALADVRPQLHTLGSNADSRQRDSLLAKLAASALPSVPLLSASNYFHRCGPSAWDEEPRFCVLLFVPLYEGHWSGAATAVYKTLQEASGHVDVPKGVRFAWVDTSRQTSFAAHVIKKGRPAGENEAPSRELELVAVRGREAGGGTNGGLRQLRVAVLPSAELGHLDIERLVRWLVKLEGDSGSVSGSSTWRAVRGQAPPLRAEVAPRIAARLYVALVSWGWMVLLLLVAVGGGAVYFWPQIKEAYNHAQKQTRQSQQTRRPQQQQHREETAAGAASEGAAQRSQRASANDDTPQRRSSEGGKSFSLAGAQKLDASSMDRIFGSGSYSLVFVFNAGLVDKGTILSLMGWAADLFESDSRYSGWSLACLDYAAEQGRASKAPLMSSLLSHVRSCPCVVVRRGQKVSLFTGQPKPGSVREWLEALKMGEVAWAALEPVD